MDNPINFLGVRRICFVISAALILGGIGSLVAKQGPNLGIDFRGGVHIVAKFSEPVSVAAANATLEAAGVPGAKIVTSSGNILLIDTVVHEAGIGQKIVAALRVGHPLADSEINEVGANVGQDLQVAGILMIVVSLGLILIYVSLRFQWRFAVGAVVALIHDVLITLGVFSVMNIEINLPTLAAFLTVVGYSINDTIVVFDRIRENQRLLRGMRFTDLINSSITQMLGRTLLTSLTTLVVVALIFWQSVAGELRTFSLALIFGIIVGTYSSIYIASPVVMMFRQRVTAGD
ncbi:protein translocase subunit SecF [Candidatus Poribacteria bacterium]|nr:protein translocase subunit SecF [Candidatus Poribacteria bacterium]MBT5536734.1 protein translocase subunit SecF [Candidatus Poribacteria bacterium]MBT7095878.1 protein translocase subunit SecF [Candidatus Poribacteria bacterium]MBT7807305.1 protein translocase subunit SecF [Candidatus Poribacteria bacterium]